MYNLRSKLKTLAVSATENSIKKEVCPGCKAIFEIEYFDNYHVKNCVQFKKFEAKLDKKLGNRNGINYENGSTESNPTGQACAPQRPQRKASQNPFVTAPPVRPPREKNLQRQQKELAAVKKEICPGCKSKFEIEYFDNYHVKNCLKFNKFVAKLDKKFGNKTSEWSSPPQRPARKASQKPFGPATTLPPPCEKNHLDPLSPNPQRPQKEMAAVMEPPENQYRTPFFYYSNSKNIQRPITIKNDYTANVIGVKCDKCRNCQCKKIASGTKL